MSFLKVELGKPLILAIDAVEQKKGNYGMQTVFIAGDDELAMSVDSAKKQLDRIGISDPAGLTLKFEKVDIGNNRTAINISQVSTHATSGPKKQQPFDQPVPPSAAVQVQTRYELYEEITDYVLESIAPKYGEGITSDTIAAIVATLYIQANKH